MNDKPVLAVETSQALCSTCIYYNEDKYFCNSMNLKNAHSEKIFRMIELVMKSAETEFNELGAIAVSSGPGSFTGLRIGMSAAKGIAFGAGLPVIPVPTFEALAQQLSVFLPENTEFIIANKVNNEELYYARFKVLNNSFIFTEALDIIRKEELKTGMDIPVYGNALNKRNISSPNALYIAKLSKSIIPVSDYDNLEPRYLKEFITKERKK